jgi:hypothetical protein
MEVEVGEVMVGAVARNVFLSTRTLSEKKFAVTRSF